MKNISTLHKLEVWHSSRTFGNVRFEEIMQVFCQEVCWLNLPASPIQSFSVSIDGVWLHTLFQFTASFTTIVFQLFFIISATRLFVWDMKVRSLNPCLSNIFFLKTCRFTIESKKLKKSLLQIDDCDFFYCKFLLQIVMLNSYCTIPHIFWLEGPNLSLH